MSTLSEEQRRLLDRQAERQRAARLLIGDLQLLERWRAYGQPVLCGSVAYGLLVAPDIDLEIIGPPETASGFALAARWATDPRVRRVRFANELGGPDAALYWQLRVEHGSRQWKVDMWLLAPDHPGPRSADLIEPLRQVLDAKTRCTILEIKEQLPARDAGSYRSIDLYRAVIDDGMASVAEFDAWRAGHATDGLVDWRPSARRG